MANPFEIDAQQDVATSRVGNSSSVMMCGPRCVAGPGMSAICTFMSQSKLGINDFVPMISHSTDGGATWSAPRQIWPHLVGKYSIFCNISRSPDGTLFIFGSRTVIDTPGEPFWSEENSGLKRNELIWSRSTDEGRTWTDPQAFALPYPGTAEAPGPMLITRAGRWVALYSPYNVMGANDKVDRNCVVTVLSDDQGKTWWPSTMIRFDDELTGGAEAWVAELTDGRLLGVTWQVDLSGKSRAFPNQFAISKDGGTTWGPTSSTGIKGNTTALIALPQNEAIFVTVRRGKEDAGIWASIVKPTETDFGVQADQSIWSATRSTQSGGEAKHDNWTDFTFGEPGITILGDGTVLMVFWYLDKTQAGIRALRLRKQA